MIDITSYTTDVTLSEEVTIAAGRTAPAVGGTMFASYAPIAPFTLCNLTLNEWVAIVTFFYVVFQFILLTITTYRKFFGRTENEKE